MYAQMFIVISGMAKYLHLGVMIWWWCSIQASPTVRLNYGVVFRPVAKVIGAESEWRHTFHIPLPDPGVASDRLSKAINSSQFAMTNDPISRQVVDILNQSYVTLNGFVESMHAILPNFNTVPSRRHRSLLPFVGSISSSLFGTLDENDKRHFQRHIAHIHARQNDLMHNFNALSEELSSFATAVDSRLDNIASFINSANEQLKIVTTSFERVLHDSDTRLRRAVSTLSRIMVNSFQLNDQLEKFQFGIDQAKKGLFTSFLVDVHSLHPVINNITLHAAQKGLKLALQDDDMYDVRKIALHRVNNSVYITVAFPVSPVSSFFHLFSTHVFAVPVNGTSDHSTIIQNFPDYFAVSPHSHRHMHLSSTQLSQCSGVSQLHCPLLLTAISQPSCASAIFADDTNLVKTLCRFQFQTKSVEPYVQEIDIGKVLIVNINKLNLTCDGIVSPIPGCKLCLITVPCNCSLTTDNFYISIRFSQCQQLTYSRLHPVNLIFLQHLFSQNHLSSISGNSLLNSTWNFTAPQIKLYQHDMTKNLALDNNLKLDLDHVIDKIKSNQPISTSPLDSVLYDNFDSSFKWLSLQGLLLIISFSLSCIYTFVILAYLAFRKHRIPLAILSNIQGTNAFDAVFSQPNLVYTPPTPSSPVFSFTPSLNEILIYFLYAILVVIVLFKAFKHCNKPHSCIILVLSGSKSCAHVPIKTWSHCPKSFLKSIHFKVDDITLERHFIFPVLSVSFSNTEKEIWKPNSTFYLSPIQAFRFKRILKKTYTAHFIYNCGPLTQYLTIDNRLYPTFSP